MQDRCNLLHTSKLRLFSQKENRPLTGRGRAWRTCRTRVSGGGVPLGEAGVASRELLCHELEARSEELGQLAVGVGVELDRREAEFDALCLGAPVETHDVSDKLHAILDRIAGPVVGLQGGDEPTGQLRLEGEPFELLDLELGHDLLLARGRDAPAHQELEEPAHLVHFIFDRGVDSPRRPDSGHVRRRLALQGRKRDLFAPVQVAVARIERESEDVASELALEGERAIIADRRRQSIEHLGPEGLEFGVTRLTHLPEVGEEQVARPVPTVISPHVQAESDEELGSTERHELVCILAFRRERIDEPLADMGEVELPKDRVALHELVELEGTTHGLKVTALSAVVPDEDVRVGEPEVTSGVLAGLDRVGLAEDGDVGDDARGVVLSADGPDVTGLPDLDPVLDQEDEHLIVAGEGHATELRGTQDVAQFPVVGLCDESRGGRLVHLDGVLDDLDGLGGPVELEHPGGRSRHHGLVTGQHRHHGGGLVAPLVEELLGAPVGRGDVTELGVDLPSRPLLVDHLEALGLFDGLGGVGSEHLLERRPGGAPDVGFADVGIRDGEVGAELTGVVPHDVGVDGRSILLDRDRDLCTPRRDVTFVHEGLVDPGSARSRSGRLDRDFLSNLAVTRGLTADQGRQQEKEQVLHHVSPRGRNVSHRAFSLI